MSNPFFVGMRNYIDMLNQLWNKVGTAGPQGDPGAQTQILSGHGAPTAQSPAPAANEGDYYLDQDSSILWQYVMTGSPLALGWVHAATIPGTGGGGGAEPVDNEILSDYGTSGSVSVSLDVEVATRNIVLTLDTDPSSITDITIAPFTFDPGTGFIPFNIVVVSNGTWDFSAVPFTIGVNNRVVSKKFMGPTTNQNHALIFRGVIVPPNGAIDLLDAVSLPNTSRMDATPRHLTVSTDAVAGNLTIDWSVSREYFVTLDAALSTFTFVTPTADTIDSGSGEISPSPLILRIAWDTGGSMDPDIWYSGGLTAIQNWREIPTWVDTGNFDAMVIHFDCQNFAGSNFPFYAMSWASDSQASDANAEIDTQTPITGFSYTMKSGCDFLMLTPGGTLATGTVTMQAKPRNRQVVTINSTQVITTFTLNGNTGQTVIGAPGSLAVNTPIRFVWDRTSNKWWPA